MAGPVLSWGPWSGHRPGDCAPAPRHPAWERGWGSVNSSLASPTFPVWPPCLSLTGLPLHVLLVVARLSLLRDPVPLPLLTTCLRVPPGMEPLLSQGWGVSAGERSVVAWLDFFHVGYPLHHPPVPSSDHGGQVLNAGGWVEGGRSQHILEAPKVPELCKLPAGQL